MAARARATPEPDARPAPMPSRQAERRASVHKAKTHLSRLLDEVRPAAPW